MRLIAPNITGVDLVESLSALPSEMPHWYQQLKSDLVKLRERMSALAALVDDATFNPYLLILFCSCGLRQRYFSGESFLISSSSFEDSRFETREDVKYTEKVLKIDSLRYVTLNRTLNNQKIQVSHNIVYGFLQIERPNPEGIAHDFSAINRWVTTHYPFIMMPDNLLEFLNRNALLENFRQSFGCILQATNHDFLHNITYNKMGGSHSANYSYTHAFDGVQTVHHPSTVHIAEEDIVLGMNAQIFRKLLNDGKGKFVNEFLTAIYDAIELIDETKAKGGCEFVEPLKDLLAYMISNYVKREYLLRVDYHEWPKTLLEHEAGHQNFRPLLYGRETTCGKVFKRLSDCALTDLHQYFSDKKTVISRTANGLKRIGIRAESPVPISTASYPESHSQTSLPCHHRSQR